MWKNIDAVERRLPCIGEAIPPLYRKMLNPTSIQKNDPTSIEEERSHPYIGRDLTRHVYRKNDPTCIQEEKRSLMYKGRDLTPYLYRDDFSHLKLFVKEKTIKHVDWKPRKRNG